MLAFVNQFNLVMFAIFTVLYIYQFFYVLVVLFQKKKRTPEARKNHRYAVIISARNESAVISELLRSIKKQNYPAELIDTFVVADNCTDDTAEVARREGAIVYERFSETLKGKGYALDYIFRIIQNDYAEKGYEGYFIFDADNLLDPNFVYEMNKQFDQGYRILTSYRNSKNYDSNWISAGYGLWFLREAKYLNNARMLLGTNCAVSGTGFLVHSDIIRKNRGWKYHLLTEDIEFSVDSAIKGERIGYCEKAIIYDEQPQSFDQSWKQRLRWSKGFYQVFGKYGLDLLKKVFTKGSFACYDMFMTIAPAMFVALGSVAVNASFLIYTITRAHPMPSLIIATSSAVFASFFNFYLVLYFFGLITTISEWKKINCAPLKKILYTFTFPVFIFTYIPISLEALFKKIEWVPITHSISKSIEEVRQ